TRNHAIDHGSLIVGGTGANASGPALLTRDLGDDEAVLAQLRVPGRERRLELVGIVPALREPHRLRRVERDPVLVPRDVPGEGDHDVAVDAGERDDADPGLTEASGDALDRPPVGALVEEVCGLDRRLIPLGHPPEDGLAGDGLDRTAGPEDAAQEAVAAPVVLERRQARRALADPAVLERGLLAERADVNVLAPVGREPHRPLAEEERPLADRAGQAEGAGARHGMRNIRKERVFGALSDRLKP